MELTVHRRTRWVFHQCRRRLRSPCARQTRARVPVYGSPAHRRRAPECRWRWVGGLRTQTRLLRWHHSRVVRTRRLHRLAIAALVPRPRAHLIRYHGLFAANAHGSAGAAKHMAGIAPAILLHSRHCTWKCRCREAQGCARAANARHRHHIVLRHISPISTEQSENTSVAPTAPMTWMARLNRVFGIDLSVCQKCGGKLRVIGEVTEPKAIARILEHAKQRGRHERDPRRTAAVARKPIPPPARSPCTQLGGWSRPLDSPVRFRPRGVSGDNPSTGRPASTLTTLGLSSTTTPIPHASANTLAQPQFSPLLLRLFGRICGSATHQVNGNRLKYR